MARSIGHELCVFLYASFAIYHFVFHLTPSSHFCFGMTETEMSPWDCTCGSLSLQAPSPN